MKEGPDQQQRLQDVRMAAAALENALNAAGPGLQVTIEHPAVERNHCPMNQLEGVTVRGMFKLRIEQLPLALPMRVYP